MDEPAQRLWALERSDQDSNAGDGDVCHFLGAIAVVRPQSVAIVFVRSAELRRASEVALRAGLLRLDLDRDASNFESLDEAIAWSDRMKAGWLARGWREIPDVHDGVAASREPSAVRQALPPV